MRNERAKICLRLQYLTGARICELVASRGLRPESCQVTNYEKHPAALFMIRTAKTKKQRIRTVALPLEPEYEPWTRSIVEYFQAALPQKPVFDLSLTMMQRYGKEAFQGLTYPIEEYLDEGKTVAQHEREITTHGLRHIRSTELTTRYGFDGIDLAIYFGWSLRKELTMPAMALRYLHMQWTRYFPKLLKTPQSSTLQSG